jgi:hypothetical protein
VGSIKIQDTETRFEIPLTRPPPSPPAIAQTGSGEAASSCARTAIARCRRAAAGQGQIRAEAQAAPRRGPRYKVAPMTAESRDAARPRADATGRRKPRPPKSNPKDKGKPKYKNRHRAPTTPMPAAPQSHKQWTPMPDRGGC